MKINPSLPQSNHNISRESTLRYFVKLLLKFLWVIVWVYLVLLCITLAIIQFVDVETERAWFWDSVYEDYDVIELPTTLAQRYENIDVPIYIIEDEEPNAFAILWWTILLTTSFLKELEYIETLDFIIWHEYGHIAEWDVLTAIIPMMPFYLVSGLVWLPELAVFSDVFLHNTLSRFQEYRADRWGLDILYEISWHVWCAFVFLDDEEEDETLLDKLFSIFSTHPPRAMRIMRWDLYAQDQGYNSEECTPFIYNDYF